MRKKRKKNAPRDKPGLRQIQKEAPVNGDQGVEDGRRDLVVAKGEFFSGPIPHPELLVKYAQVDAELPRRITGMTEKQQTHDHRMEERSLRLTERGQIFAFVLSLVIVIGSLVLIGIGKAIYGMVLAGGTLTALAYLFITGRPPPKN